MKGGRGDDHRHGESVAEKLRFEAAPAHVHQHAVVDAQALEGGAIFRKRDLVVGAARVVVQDLAGKAPRRFALVVFEIRELHDRGQGTPAPVPGAIGPVRWASQHDGEILFGSSYVGLGSLHGHE